MNSLVSPLNKLEKTELEPHLIAFQCAKSGGYYLPAASYWRWLAKNPARLPQLPDSGEESPEEEEIANPRLCPESGAPMLRFKVGHGFSFTIDRSPTGGVWFDKGEWEALRARNFHDEIHLIFTLPWQNKVRRLASKERLNQALITRIGEPSFEKATEFKTWLHSQEERSAILAFLSNDS